MALVQLGDCEVAEKAVMSALSSGVSKNAPFDGAGLFDLLSHVKINSNVPKSKIDEDLPFSIEAVFIIEALTGEDICVFSDKCTRESLTELLKQIRSLKMSIT